MIVKKIDVPRSFRNFNGDEVINIGICCIYGDINKKMISKILSKRLPDIKARDQIISLVSFDDVMSFYEDLHSLKSIDYTRTVIFLIDNKAGKFILKQ